MKKKILSFIFAICLIIPCVLFVGCTKEKEPTKSEEPITSIGLEYALINNNTEYSVVGIGTCMDANIVIPSMYEGKPVTKIGEMAFYICETLTSITIPNGVTVIDEAAFYGCDFLTSVEIPNSVTTIGESAFRWCSSLTTVTIPEGVTTIENSAFERCGLLTSVTIPNSVTTIGDRVFEGCGSLISITICSGDISNSIIDYNSVGTAAYYVKNTIYIKSDLPVNNSIFLLEYFTKQATSDKTGYDMYVKNS